MPPEVRVAYQLHPRQMDAMNAIWNDGVEQIVYGGAAGGGKSLFIRALAFACSQAWPSGRIAIFRDNYTQLQKTQVEEWKREMRALGMDPDDYWNETNAEWRFPTPYGDTIVEFLHISQEIGAEKWLSAEWAAVLVDESTQIKEKDLRLLQSRVRAKEDLRNLWKRLADEREAAGMPRMDWRPLRLLATNPGSISHAYHYEEFVIPGRDNGLEPWNFEETVEVNGREVHVSTKRQFIPAYLSDNPSLDFRQYVATLAQLPKQRREQMLSGDWDFFEGKTFSMLDPDIHYVDAKWAFNGKLVPPPSWPRMGGLDHGTASPTAAEWSTRDEDGFFITYMEYYSAGPVGQHVNAIHSLCVMDGFPQIVFEADPRMWHKSRGNERMWSVADEYAYGGEPPIQMAQRHQAMQNGVRLHQATIDRLPGRIAMQRLLEPNPNLMFPDWHPRGGEYGAPRLFICIQCPNLWRELNGIMTDPSNQEETLKLNDHGYDAEYRSVPVFEHRLNVVYGRRRPRQVIAG